MEYCHKKAHKHTNLLLCLLCFLCLLWQNERSCYILSAIMSRKAQGERTRKAILETAVHIASAEGLEGLTIGRLALELSMSKSGLFAHFGSKEELQVATVEAAHAIFIR